MQGQSDYYSGSVFYSLRHEKMTRKAGSGKNTTTIHKQK